MLASMLKPLFRSFGYLFAVLVAGLGLALSGWVPAVTVVSAWFSAKRGLAIGIASAGIGLGTVAFVPPARSRFFRNWSTGFRLKTTFFRDYDRDNKCDNKALSNDHKCVPDDIFPGTVDFTIGQDESVTGGRLRHFVLTLDANYPFPGVPWLRIFGTAHSALEHNRTIPTLLLLPAQTPVAITDSSVILQPIPQLDQDYFRLGFGVDFVRAFKQLKSPPK